MQSKDGVVSYLPNLVQLQANKIRDEEANSFVALELNMFSIHIL